MRIARAEEELEKENIPPCKTCGMLPHTANPLFRSGVVSLQLAQELSPPLNMKKRSGPQKLTQWTFSRLIKGVYNILF